jgi:hypothetical protein
MNVIKAVFHWGEMAFNMRKSRGIFKETLTIVSLNQIIKILLRSDCPETAPTLQRLVVVACVFRS